MTEYVEKIARRERDERIACRKLNLWISLEHSEQGNRTNTSEEVGTTRVAQASRKSTEIRLNWCGHVVRRDEDHI